MQVKRKGAAARQLGCTYVFITLLFDIIRQTVLNRLLAVYRAKWNITERRFFEFTHKLAIVHRYVLNSPPGAITTK